jgi:hypothetical protein
MESANSELLKQECDLINFLSSCNELN